MAVVWLGVLLFYDMRSGRMILREAHHSSHRGTVCAPVWDWKVLRKLAWLAAPLGVVMMLNSLNANIPRYVVEHHLGQWELGIFAALAYLQLAENTVVTALGQSATPRLAANFAQKRTSAFRGLNVRLVAIGLAIGGTGVLMALLFGHWLLTLLYRPEYAAYSSVFVWLMIGAALSNVAAFLGYGLTAARCFHVQMTLLVAESLVLCGTCLYLIPKYNLMGAAVAYVIAKGFLIALSALALAREMRRARRVNSVAEGCVDVG